MPGIRLARALAREAVRLAVEARDESGRLVSCQANLNPPDSDGDGEVDPGRRAVLLADRSPPPRRGAGPDGSNPVPRPEGPPRPGQVEPPEPQPRLLTLYLSMVLSLSSGVLLGSEMYTSWCGPISSSPLSSANSLILSTVLSSSP